MVQILSNFPNFPGPDYTMYIVQQCRGLGLSRTKSLCCNSRLLGHMTVHTVTTAQHNINNTFYFYLKKLFFFVDNLSVVIILELPIVVLQ